MAKQANVVAHLLRYPCKTLVGGREFKKHEEALDATVLKVDDHQGHKEPAARKPVQEESHEWDEGDVIF